MEENNLIQGTKERTTSLTREQQKHEKIENKQKNKATDHNQTH